MDGPLLPAASAAVLLTPKEVLSPGPRNVDVVTVLPVSVVRSHMVCSSVEVQDVLQLLIIK